MLTDFISKKCYAAFKLCHPFHSVFNTDPPIKTNPFKFCEDGIVIIKAFANFTMAQTLCISSDTSFLFSQVVKGACMYFSLHSFLTL